MHDRTKQDSARAKYIPWQVRTVQPNCNKKGLPGCFVLRGHVFNVSTPYAATLTQRKQLETELKRNKKNAELSVLNILLNDSAANI
jgi:hypothetical protein